MKDSASVTVQDIEQYLYEEAAMLDEWRLQEWLALLTADAEYQVPAPDAPNGDTSQHLALINDDRRRINARVKHYVDGHAYAENPRSKLRRLVTNVRIVSRDPAQNELKIAANFVVYRFHNMASDVFVGHYDYLLRFEGEALKIRRRRAILDVLSLEAQGKLSIII